MYDTVDSSVWALEVRHRRSSVFGGSANDEGSNRGNPTFMKVAHVHGLCSLDELIQACRSSGCEAMAGDLEAVKDQLREERVKGLVDLGLKTTNASNALLDTMLFRFHDLFQKVITKQSTRDTPKRPHGVLVKVTKVGRRSPRRSRDVVCILISPLFISVIHPPGFDNT